MQTKTYFASSVPAAIEVARQELGENTLLVSSKPAPSEARHFGRLEVTFAWDPKEGRRDAPLQRIERVPSTRAATAGRAASEIDEIKQQLSALRLAMGGSGPVPGAPIERGENFVVETLVENGFSREMAEEIASVAGHRSGNPETLVVREISNRIPIAPFVEMKSGESRTLAFIGPPGRGKTVSMIKLAVTLGLARRIPVRIYCAGAHGIGAQEQAARFAAILGTPYQAFESLASLNLALNGEGWKGLALIDTPGLAPADRHELNELSSFFAARPEIEKHLVLRADASSADMLHMMSRFSSLAPSRILFAGMDEVICVAPMIESLIRGGIPATFAGTGQQIPEDLEEVCAGKLARAAWAGSVVWGDAAAPAEAVTDTRFAQAAA